MLTGGVLIASCASILLFRGPRPLAARLVLAGIAILVVLFTATSEANAKSSWRDGLAGWNATVDSA